MKYKLIAQLYYIRAIILEFFCIPHATHFFFFSQKQKEVNLNISLWNSTFYNDKKAHFKGIYYTEMRGFRDGWSNWEDAVLIGIGGYDDITWGEESRDTFGLDHSLERKKITLEDVERVIDLLRKPND